MLVVSLIELGVNAELVLREIAFELFRALTALHTQLAGFAEIL